MDPATLRLLITVAAPIVAGLGGAAIVFFSAQRVALHTLEAQRQLATDEAVRRWRMEDVRRLLDAITREIDLYQRIAKKRRMNAPQEEIKQLADELSSCLTGMSTLRRCAASRLLRWLLQWTNSIRQGRKSTWCYW